MEREDALAWTDRVRAARERLRSDLREGRVTLGDVLGEPVRGVATGGVKLLHVLESLPGAGKVATRRRLTDLGLDANTPVGDLDAAQVIVLLEEFPLEPT